MPDHFCPSVYVCLSVLPSHCGVLSRRLKVTIMRFSASGILDTGEVKFIRIFAAHNFYYFECQKRAVCALVNRPFRFDENFLRRQTCKVITSRTSNIKCVVLCGSIDFYSFVFISVGNQLQFLANCLSV